jgi:hypothetical protein
VAEIARTYTIGGQEVPQYICGSWSDSTREEVTDFCKEREARQKAEAEVERLRGLLEKVLFELEKVPFQTPKLTAFTAHRLADRYRKQLDQRTK